MTRRLVRLVATVAVPAAVGIGLVAVALPRPSPQAKLGVRVLDRLQQTPIRGALVSIAGHPLRASCRRLSSHTAVVSLDDGQRLVLHDARVTAYAPARVGGSRELAAVRVAAPADAELPAAEADLAGTRALYEKELIGGLVNGRRVVVGRIRYGGVLADVVRLGGTRPRVDLLVDARTLRPLGVRYASRRIVGSSILLSASPGC